MDSTDKVVVFIEECRRMGLKVTPPAINASDFPFTVDEEGRILYGLGAIKGAGEAAIEVILEERRNHGPFQDLFDLCRRVELRKLNRRVLESLIRSGACDELGANRAALMAQLPEALQLAEQNSRNDASGQNDLFGLPAESLAPRPSVETDDIPEWDEETRLNGEKEALGLYLTGHPIHRFKPELRNFTTGSLADIGTRGGRDKDRQVVIAGLVVGIRTRNSNRGGRMAFVTLDDGSGRLEIRVFSKAYELYRRHIVNDKVVVVRGSLAWDDFSEGMRLNVEQIMDMDEARNEYARRLVLSLDAGHFNNGLVGQLAATLAQFRQGRCHITVNYTRPRARAEIVFDPTWRVSPAEALLGRLRELVGNGNVTLEYR
jgi:DNA polymerase-3 subunit alpha